MKIVFLGGGNMASALIGGLLTRGFQPTDLAVIEKLPEARDALAQRYGVRVFDAVNPELREAQTIVLAVKPQDLRLALAPWSGQLSHQLVISIAAGITLNTLSRWLGGYNTLVRAMPNTPALIGAGAAGLFAASDVSAEERQRAEAILGAVGITAWVNEETLIDAVTALSGSGPAYVFYFIEAIEQAGRQLGLTAAVARALAIQTFVGASQLAAASDESPARLRERVTSKGGTTEAALNVFAEQAIAAQIAQGLQAANARGAALGKLLDKD